jgi:hypothetical protein
MGHGNESGGGSVVGIIVGDKASGELVGGLVMDGEPQHGVGPETGGVRGGARVVLVSVVYLPANENRRLGRVWRKEKLCKKVIVANRKDAIQLDESTTISAGLRGHWRRSVPGCRAARMLGRTGS